MPTGQLILRAATLTDAQTLCVVATQVFVETYAPQGLTPILAREALTNYSVDRFLEVLASRHVMIAEVDGFAVGFAEMIAQRGPLAHGPEGLEVTRLYVLKSHKGQGIGRTLMDHALGRAAAAGLPNVWLTAWVENHNARAFYAALGFVDVGRSDYEFENQRFENRVLVKPVGRSHE